MNQGMIDIYCQDGPCYIWLYLEFNGDDLSLDTLYPIPESHWLCSELDYCGWDCLFDSRVSWSRRLDNPFYRVWIDYAFQNSLGPNKPFLMRFDPPHYYQCNSYFDPVEWDVEYSYEIIWKPQYTLEDWQEVFSEWEHLFGQPLNERFIL